MTKYGGAVAACGLAGGMDLPSSVAPFILRGVALLGIDSVQCPVPDRVAAWSRLAKEMDRNKLKMATREVDLPNVVQEADAIISGRVRGRTVIRIK
jgi:acrylyl-CoA reductase (NADPH)